MKKLERDDDSKKSHHALSDEPKGGRFGAGENERAGQGIAARRGQMPAVKVMTYRNTAS